MTKKSPLMQHSVQSPRRLRRMLTAPACAALILSWASAGAADAKTETLNFYQVQVGQTRFYNAAGRAIDLNPPTTLPQAGDRFDETDLDYPGTPKRHAARWTASDHFTCTFTSSDTGVCNSQIAIGGSLLLSNNFPLPTGEVAVAAVNEGTGVFHDAHGRFTDADLPNSSDAVLTIDLSYARSA
jgi:hypothetical protein